jgi:hypothetical protein
MPNALINRGGILRCRLVHINYVHALVAGTTSIAAVATRMTSLKRAKSEFLGH